MSVDEVQVNSVRVDTDHLQVGMYVCQLDRPWLETPFLFQGFYIRDEEDIAELRRHCVYVHVDIDESDPAVGLTKPKKARTLRPAVTLRKKRGFGAFLKSLLGRESLLGQETATGIDPGRTGTFYRDTVPLREELATAEESHSEATRLMDAVMGELRDGGKLDMATAKQAVSPMVESVLRNQEAMAWLCRMREQGDYIYTHAVSSSVWAVVFGRHLGLDRESLETVGLGAMLLDVGETKIPKELLMKPGPLTESERALMERHVEFGMEILNETKGINAEVKAMVQSHHERHNGSGYPGQLKGSAIPVFARIAGIVDTYDAITSHRPHVEAQSAYDCMRTLSQLSDVDFQSEMVEQFTQAVGFFPTGTVVELSNGAIGIVIAQNRRRRLKPQVMLIRDKSGNPLEEYPVLDLQTDNLDEATRQSIYILRGLQAEKLGIDPSEYYL